MNARDRDGFRQALRALGSKRVIDFSPGASLSWPEKEWYPPTTPDEIAAQDAIRGARAQGLPDRISDGMTMGKLAVLLKGGAR